MSTEEAGSGKNGGPEAQAPQTPAPAQQAQQSIKLDDEQVVAHYANFCRVSSTPEELILDLALNPQPFAEGQHSIRVSQRIILNHYTAKRLLHALAASIQRHEANFGVIETDVRKRVRAGS